ncbi:hypothetical protein QQ045_013263 [Rhodiola kirilowii]
MPHRLTAHTPSSSSFDFQAHSLSAYTIFFFGSSSFTFKMIFKLIFFLGLLVILRSIPNRFTHRHTNHNRHSAYTITAAIGTPPSASPSPAQVAAIAATPSLSPSAPTPVVDAPTGSVPATEPTGSPRDNASTGLSGAAVFSTALLGVFVGYLFEISSFVVC